MARMIWKPSPCQRGFFFGVAGGATGGEVAVMLDTGFLRCLGVFAHREAGLHVPFRLKEKRPGGPGRS